MAASMSACVRCRKIDHLTKQNKVVRGEGKRENKTKTKINKWNARKINWIARTSEWDTKEGAQHSWRIEAGPNTTNQATSPNDASEFFFSLDSHSSPSLSCSLRPSLAFFLPFLVLALFDLHLSILVTQHFTPYLTYIPLNFDSVTKYSYIQISIHLNFFVFALRACITIVLTSDQRGKKSSVKQNANKRNELKQNKTKCTEEKNRLYSITCNMSAKSRFNQ